ncbi:MAG: hypothetical protein K2K97_00920 [Muribaculaceae bacterium]|nr:hypothetical protein [Muribaculaceae bacterium]
MEKFDLTTKDGIIKVAKFLNGGRFLEFFPLVNLAKILIERIFTKPEETGKVVQDIIEKGKKEGVDEMEIKIKDGSGVNLKVPVDGAEIKLGIGKDNETIIRVKYK